MLYGEALRYPTRRRRTSRELWELAGAVAILLFVNGIAMVVFPLLLGVVISSSYGETWGTSAGGALMAIVLALAGPSVAHAIKEVAEG